MNFGLAIPLATLILLLSFVGIFGYNYFKNPNLAHCIENVDKVSTVDYSPLTGIKDYRIYQDVKDRIDKEHMAFIESEHQICREIYKRGIIYIIGSN